MFHGAFKDYDKDGKIWFRTDGSVFNNQKLKAKTKTSCMLLRELLLFADNCALIANSEEDTQSIVDDFARAADRYGLTISIKNTEVLHPPRPRTPPSNPVVTIGNEALKVVDKFCCLGGTISQMQRLMMRSWHGSARAARLLDVYSIVCRRSLVCD